MKDSDIIPGSGVFEPRLTLSEAKDRGKREMDNKLSRRKFIKLSSAAGLGAVVGGLNLTGCSNLPIAKINPIKSPPLETVRIGFVGVGNRGTGNLKNLLKIEGVEIRAVCDIVEEKVSRAQRLVEKAGQPMPTGYCRGETDFKRLCEQEELDLVVTATPWRWHSPVCLAAMNAGKHAASEVPAAVTIDQCWELVETSEKSNKY